MKGGRTLWMVVTAVVLAIVVLGVWSRASARATRQLDGVLAEYETATHAGDWRKVLAVSDPAAIERVRLFITAARSESEAALRARPWDEAIAILNLRARYTSRQLGTLTPEEEIRRLFSVQQADNGTTLRASEISLENGRASASISSVDSGDTRVYIGRDAYFVRVGDHWLFDWGLMQHSIMTRVAGPLDQRDRVKIIEQSLREEHPGADVTALWKGPRP